jgi:hypothetical protein
MKDSRSTGLLHGLSAVGGLSLAMLLARILGPATASGSAVLEGYAVDRQAHTTVYAPSSAAARQAQQEVRYARDRFREMFATEPVDLVVVLAQDPAEFLHLDLEPLRYAGASVLPFVTRTHLESISARPASQPQHFALTRANPLAHEACHVFMAALADRTWGELAGGRGAYGHNAMSDWLDESAATLCESPEGRAIRRRHLRASLDRLIPLRELERMEHPLAATHVLELRQGRQAAEYRVEVNSDEGARKRVLATNTLLFYSQALSLGEFIAERGGPSALPSLVRPLSGGRTLGESLHEVRRTAPDLPSTLAELEAEWLQWLGRDDR